MEKSEQEKLLEAHFQQLNDEGKCCKCRGDIEQDMPTIEIRFLKHGAMVDSTLKFCHECSGAILSHMTSGMLMEELMDKIGGR